MPYAAYALGPLRRAVRVLLQPRDDAVHVMRCHAVINTDQQSLRFQNAAPTRRGAPHARGRGVGPGGGGKTSAQTQTPPAAPATFCMMTADRATPSFVRLQYVQMLPSDRPEETARLS